jgi:hypothetical protein
MGGGGGGGGGGGVGAGGGAWCMLAPFTCVATQVLVVY